MTQLTDKHWAVPMPDNAESCELRGPHPGRKITLLSFYGEGEAIELPPGDWQIVIFNTKTATDKDAKKVVDVYLDGYVDYDKDGFHNDIPHSAPLFSFYSLLRSKGLDEEKNYAIIEKQ